MNPEMAKIWISTTVYGTEFLSASWQTRASLTEYARRGLAEFAYITFCAHIEATLAEMVFNRCRSIRRLIRWEELPKQKWNDNGQLKFLDVAPVTQSLLDLVYSIEEDAHQSPLGKLKEQYRMIFNKSVRDSIGIELDNDLLAVAAMRNIFAHGRYYYVELPDHSMNPEAIVSFDANPIQKAAIQLQKAGIVKTMQVDGSNHDSVNEELHSDAAVLYFNDAAIRIEEKLLAANDYELELGTMRTTPTLIRLLP